MTVSRESLNQELTGIIEPPRAPNQPRFFRRIASVLIEETFKFIASHRPLTTSEKTLKKLQERKADPSLLMLGESFQRNIRGEGIRPSDTTYQRFKDSF